MKKSLMSILFWILTTPFSAFSQLEISPFYGYFFGGNIPYLQGDLKINNSACYGMILGFSDGGDASLELSYTAARTSAEWRPIGKYVTEFPARKYRLDVNYLTISGVRNGELGNNVVGFAAVRGGAAWFNSNQPDINTNWYFAAEIRPLMLECKCG